MRRLQGLTLCSLIESSQSGNVWKVVIIEEGLSKNGKYYPEECLKPSIPLFENSKVCFYEWKDNHFDHIPAELEKVRPEGFPLQTAGVIKDVKYETVEVEGREVTGLTGKMHLFKTDKVKNLRQTITEGWKKGLKNLLGLSINAAGPSTMKMLNGVPIQVVQAIKQVFSTDIVTQPAAGGSLINLIESYNHKEGGNNKMFEKILASLKKLLPNLFASVDIKNVTQEEIIGMLESLEKSHKYSNTVESVIGMIKDKKLDEAQSLVDKVKEAEEADAAAGEEEDKDKDKKKVLTDEELVKTPDEELDPAQLEKKKALLDKKKDDEGGEEEDAGKEMEAKMAAYEKKLQMRECKEMLRDLIGESKLPQPIKDKIAKSFAGRIFQESSLQESITIERETLAKLFDDGSMLDLGDDVIDFSVRSPADRLQCSLDLSFGYTPDEHEKDAYKNVDEFGSLREAYVAFTDDPGISGQMGPAAMARLQEANTSATFSYALGYTINRRMLKEYKALPELWKNIANTVSVKDFKMNEVIQWGGFGILPEVIAARTTQGTETDTATPSYGELGFPADTEATYGVGTKGGIVTITRRMIINDDLKILKKLPQKLASAANHTLNQFVFDLMLNMSSGTINGNTIYDSAALYATEHQNYQTVAFSYDNLIALLDKMWYQVETGLATTANDGTLAAGDTTFTVTSGTGILSGDIIKCEGELMRVTSVATHNLTVVRGQYGTTDASHADAKAVYVVSKFIAIGKPNLWVPRGLLTKALEIMGSDKNPEAAENAINTIKGQFTIGGGGACQYLQGDENNYYLTAPTSDLELIEMGFLNGKQEPEILLQDNPTVGNVFTYDTLKYKVRHEYGGAIVDYRGAAAGIVA